MDQNSLTLQNYATSSISPVSAALPPIIAGHQTSHTEAQVRQFYGAIADIFERWVTRSPSTHTQRSYRKSVMTFVEFMAWHWPNEAGRILAGTIPDVQAWRSAMIEAGYAPKTINHRLAAVSSFYQFLAGCAAEMRLPLVVPNPCHVQFIARLKDAPKHETLSLTPTLVRQLMGLVIGETVKEYQDRAIIKTMLYTGIRINTLRLLDVAHFFDMPDDPRLEITEKGGDRRVIGIHPAAAQALREHIQKSSLESGPLFRGQAAWNTPEKLHPHRRIDTSVLWGRLHHYLRQLPGAVVKELVTDQQEQVAIAAGQPMEVERCIYTPHSLRATTATHLLSLGVDITKVQELLGHKRIETTRIYDKRRRTTRESASHEISW